MKILIAGGTGFIGRALVAALQQEHDVSVISRHNTKVPGARTISWDTLAPEHCDGQQAIINLCGENIGDKRWSHVRKKAILESRVTTTQKLVQLIQACKQPPHLYNASAIGIYPTSREALPPLLDESHALTQAKDFLSEVAIAWEQAAQSPNISETRLRFGVVLGAEGGMLKKVLPVYKMGFGGRIANGMQYMSWIHIDDLVNAIIFLLKNPSIQGPVNITAPMACTQIAFAKSLAQQLHRPCLLPMPKQLVELVYGEMGRALLLSSQQVEPSVLSEQGFHFDYPNIENALKQIVGR